MTKQNAACLVLATVLSGLSFMALAQPAPVDIGSRLELMVDDFLVDHLVGGASFQLQHPVPREIAVVHDQPWEGSMCDYHTVFKDGDLFRMYYTMADTEVLPEGGVRDVHPLFCGYAESRDGIHWDKPSLDLFEFNGSKDNNIVWMGEGAHDFDPFIDTNPACTPEARYKCVALANGTLSAFQSADAIHWSPMAKNPIITKGAFDTQNIAFWDSIHNTYRAYIRDFHNGIRDIRTSTSPDFENWTEPVMLQFPGAPDEALYTNQVMPYYRAPHILLGFPTRYTERAWSPSMDAAPDPEHRRRRAKASERYGTAITDGLFMSSRDGLTFKRWGEAFVRPGIERMDNWIYGDGYQNWGIIETKPDIPNAPNELSVFYIENNWKPSCHLRRFTLRIDGFVSVNAPMSGGEFVTRPLVFSGRHLALNFSTSAAGSIRIELQDAAGAPLPGFALDDAPEIFGDALDRVAPWKEGRDLSGIAGQPVRLRFVMKDADVFSFQFRD